MKMISRIEFHTGSKEERLPGFTPDFPYISSCVDVNKYPGKFCPWHWHQAVELFYIESGALEYFTPKDHLVFPKGSGGIINSNILHMTRALPESSKTLQLLHIFSPSLIGGERGNRIEQKYVTPLTTAPQIEIIPLFPDNPSHVPLLNAISDSFRLSERDNGFEIKLRAILSDIWFQFFILSQPLLEKKENYDKRNDKIKQMMAYIHEHYFEKISISEVADAAFISERECFRLFHDCLHVTPSEYLKSYRLSMACSLLSKSQESITYISQVCGLGSSSYFGKVFREYTGCTPLNYRRRWRDNDIKGQK